MRWLKSTAGIATAITCISLASFIGWKVYQNVLRAHDALVQAEKFRIRSERDALTDALHLHHDRYAVDPPTETDPAEIEQAFRKMFPQYHGNLTKDLAAQGLKIGKLNEAKMLVFFLGDRRDTPDSKKLIGFSPNPVAPSERTYRDKPGFEFDAERLVDADNDGWLDFQTPPIQGKHGVYKLSFDQVRNSPKIVVIGLDVDDSGSSETSSYSLQDFKLRIAAA